MIIGIDLTWVKPGKNGGTEFYIRNLLDGFKVLKNDYSYILFVADNNKKTFESYLNDSRFRFSECHVNTEKLVSRVIWKNTQLYRLMRKEKIDLAFFPVYDMPLYKYNDFKIVTVIHDLQALHYPEYFTNVEKAVLKASWKRVVKNADKVVGISNYVKNDIEEHYGTKNVVAIHNPIVIKDTFVDFHDLQKKYGIKDNEYYYTVSSLLPHKNLKTILEVIKKIVYDNIALPKKLLISGVGGKQLEEIKRYLDNYKLNDNVILTGFISNEERNTLMKHANAFVFPSVFEGFGMPPIEAMLLGSKVLTTKCTSLEEVTMGRCNYVNDAFNIDDWINKLKEIKEKEKKVIPFPEYEVKKIAQEYLDLFDSLV